MKSVPYKKFMLCTIDKEVLGVYILRKSQWFEHEGKLQWESSQIYRALASCWSLPLDSRFRGNDKGAGMTKKGQL